MLFSDLSCPKVRPPGRGDGFLPAQEVGIVTELPFLVYQGAP